MPSLPDEALITFTILNAAKDSFQAVADLNTGRPAVTGGGGKWNVIDRPQQTGVTVFDGYDPLQLVVPLLFDNMIFNSNPTIKRDPGDTIQDDVDLLWKMAGRGVGAANTRTDKSGTTGGPPKMPPVIEVNGELLPKMIRFSTANSDPSNWVVTDITEDSSGAIHNSANHLVRLPVTVTLEQYVTTAALASLSPAPPPSKTKTKTNVYPAGDTMRAVATKQRTTVVHLRDLNNYGKNHVLDGYLRDPSKRFKKAVSVKVPRVDA